MSTQDKLADALRKLLDYADSLTCRHEQTHRGGSIWTICDDCGVMWEDSGGGFVPYPEPASMAAARLALAEHDAPDECFCDRMYPDSNPNASCGDCPTRDYAPQPAPAHVQVDVLSELADEIEEAYPNADASNLRAFAAAHPPAPAADGAGELPPLPHGDAFCDIADWNEESIGMCGAWSEHLSINSRYTMPLYTESSVRTYTRSAIAALRQPVPDAMREDVLIRQLRGRAAFLRNRGRVKSPALMEEAASRLESALASQQESRNG